jgi:ABC-type metal ion transport system substrate-binding protein
MPQDISTNPQTVKIADLDAQQLLLRKRSFVALAATRAYRYREGELTRHDAIDWLQQWAEHNGLTEACGQDTIQAVIARVFAELPHD